MTFNELYQLVMEMPKSSGVFHPGMMDNKKYNMTSYDEIISEQNKYHYYEQFPFRNYEVYLKENTNKWLYYVLDHSQKLIILEATIIKQKYYSSDSLWKFKNSEKNLMLFFFRDILLQKFPHIQSEDFHSDSAIKFWKKLMVTLIPHGYKFYAILYNNGTVVEEIPIIMDETFDDQLEEYWSSSDYRIRVYAK